MNADLALQKLKEGNQRYVSKTMGGGELATLVNRSPVEDGQSPFAIILGCSDSRVPAEMVFHRGLGDLFVVRVAGNIIEPSQIGSIEFACQNFGTELVVVLGHSHCGAVNATVKALLDDSKQSAVSENIAAIVNQISPAVRPVVDKHRNLEHAELVHKAMRANIEQTVIGLQTRSRDLSALIASGKLKIVGGEYSLESGVVDFYTDD